MQQFISMVTLLSGLYLFCHFGHEITQYFENIADTIYQLAWYVLPLDMQKDILLIVAFAQRRIFIRGHAGSHCNRETFMKVCYIYQKNIPIQSANKI